MDHPVADDDFVTDEPVAAETPVNDDKSPELISSDDSQQIQQAISPMSSQMEYRFITRSAAREMQEAQKMAKGNDEIVSSEVDKEKLLMLFKRIDSSCECNSDSICSSSYESPSLYGLFVKSDEKCNLSNIGANSTAHGSDKNILTVESQSTAAVNNSATSKSSASRVHYASDIPTSSRHHVTPFSAQFSQHRSLESGPSTVVQEAETIRTKSILKSRSSEKSEIQSTGSKRVRFNFEHPSNSSQASSSSSDLSIPVGYALVESQNKQIISLPNGRRMLLIIYEQSGKKCYRKYHPLSNDYFQTAQYDEFYCTKCKNNGKNTLVKVDTKNNKTYAETDHAAGCEMKEYNLDDD